MKGRREGESDFFFHNNLREREQKIFGTKKGEKSSRIGPRGKVAGLFARRYPSMNKVWSIPKVIDRYLSKKFSFFVCLGFVLM